MNEEGDTSFNTEVVQPPPPAQQAERTGAKSENTIDPNLRESDHFFSSSINEHLPKTLYDSGRNTDIFADFDIFDLRLEIKKKIHCLKILQLLE